MPDTLSLIRHRSAREETDATGLRLPMGLARGSVVS